MITKTEATYRVDIWIGGDLNTARDTLRAFCLAEGFCATLTATEFVYTGGAETGVRIGCINYPRFPVSRDVLWETAMRLAQQLMVNLHQRSFSICADDRTDWVSRA